MIRKALALGQAKANTFRDRLLPDNKLECLSNTLHSMSRRTLFNSFMFYKAADQMQINTKDIISVIQLQVPSPRTHILFILQTYLKWCHFWVSFGDFLLVFLSTILLQVLGPTLC